MATCGAGELRALQSFEGTMSKPKLFHGRRWCVKSSQNSSKRVVCMCVCVCVLGGSGLQSFGNEKGLDGDQAGNSFLSALATYGF